MQRVLGYTPLQAGLAFLPQTIPVAVGSQVTSRLVTRTGPRPLLLVGTAISAVGLAWLSRITPASAFVPDLLGPFLLLGAGLGLSVTPVTISATSGVPREQAGLASGLLNTSRIVGASIGLAALATVAADRTATLLARGTATAAGVALAVTDGYARAMAVGAVILVLTGVVAALTIPPLRSYPTEAAAASDIAQASVAPRGVDDEDGPDDEVELA